jgi:hypothetical protein
VPTASCTVCDEWWARFALPTLQEQNSRRHCCRRPFSRGKVFRAYFGYLNSGAAFSASLVVFIVATHLSFLVSRFTLTEDGDTAT